MSERHKRLEEFAAETEDENFRKQITEMLSVEKINAGKYKGSDFSDASVTVEYVHEDYICHDHVNPAFLERYEPEKGEDDYDICNF